MSRFAFRAAAGLVLPFVLLACGESARTDHGTDDGQSLATLGGGPTGGVLIVLADREPDQLNPLTYSSNPAYQAVQLMFRPLARRDSTLSGYAPDLARSWEMQDDSTLVLVLRDDVHWHDGVRVTADDVVFTIERQRDAATASPRRADVSAVTRVAARDSVTVAVTLARTGLYTVNSLLEVVTVPRHLLGDVPAAELRNAPFGRSPVGNGFYRFAGWTAGQSLTLDADARKPDGRAAIERIIMRFVPEMNAAVTQLLAGQGDLIAKLPPEQKPRMQQAANVDVHLGPRVRPAWIAWNTRRPPLDDVRVRQALLMGIDRDALARGLFGDVGEPAYSPVPTVLREHDPGVTPVPYDPDGARRLLAEAGWRDANAAGVLQRGGQPLRIEVDFISTDPERRDVLVAMQSMLRRIGAAAAAHAARRAARRLLARRPPGAPLPRARARPPPANVKSVSKSVLSAVVGHRHRRGPPARRRRPARRARSSSAHLRGDDARSGSITVGHLLSMQSGWSAPPAQLRPLGHSRELGALRAHPADGRGARRRALYSTGNSHLLAALLTQATGQHLGLHAGEAGRAAGHQLPRWPTDPQGIYFGGNEMRMTPRAMVRFGELYRNGGRHDGRQVVPEDWVRASLTPRRRGAARRGLRLRLVRLAGARPPDVLRLGVRRPVHLRRAGPRAHGRDDVGSRRRPRGRPPPRRGAAAAARRHRARPPQQYHETGSYRFRHAVLHFRSGCTGPGKGQWRGPPP
jgi:peptide/nickel transport system substrate-binding protein